MVRRGGSPLQRHERATLNAGDQPADCPVGFHRPGTSYVGSGISVVMQHG